MSGNLNLKAVFQADTSDLAKGAKQAKQDIKDFGRVSNEVASSVGDAFGVDTDRLVQMSNAARELGRKLSESGNTGVKAFGELLKSLDLAKTAIAGLGIGAAVSAFKLLNAEAEAFKNTVEGAKIDIGTAAYMDTYNQVLHDFNEATGKGMAEFQEGWKETFGRFKANFGSNILSALAGKQTFGSMGEIAAASLLGNTPIEGVARSNAEQARDLAREIYDIQREIARKSVEWADKEAEIAELRRKAKDDTEGLAAQAQAIAQAQALVNERYQEEISLRQQVADKAAQISGFASDSVEAEDAMLAAARQVADIKRGMQTTLKSLERDQRSLSQLAQAEAEAWKEKAAAAEKYAAEMRKAREDFEAMKISKPSGDDGGLIGKATTEMGVTALIRPVVDKEATETAIIELSSTISSGVAELSESIGTLLADLTLGGDAWENFKSSALSAIGDMAISVGKLAISTGLTTEAIKTSLSTLQGYGAIAAGAALVALGAAVKTGAKNIAAGNYSAAGTIAPAASYGSANMHGGGYASSSINLNISGKLTADGRDLSIVLNNENVRKKTVT